MVKSEFGTHDRAEESGALYFFYKRALDQFRQRKLLDAMTSPDADCWL